MQQTADCRFKKKWNPLHSWNAQFDSSKSVQVWKQKKSARKILGNKCIYTTHKYTKKFWLGNQVFTTQHLQYNRRYNIRENNKWESH